MSNILTPWEPIVDLVHHYTQTEPSRDEALNQARHLQDTYGISRNYSRTLETRCYFVSKTMRGSSREDIKRELRETYRTVSKFAQRPIQAHRANTYQYRWVGVAKRENRNLLEEKIKYWKTKAQDLEEENKRLRALLRI